jgi:hypothetical protein
MQQRRWGTSGVAVVGLLFGDEFYTDLPAGSGVLSTVKFHPQEVLIPKP